MIRHLIIWLSLALFCASSSAAHAQPIRILTAQADGLDAVIGEPPPTDAQGKRLSQIADTLRPADADLVVIDGIPNRSHALKLAALLKRVQQDLGLTALHITHSRHEAAQLADVIFRMEAGRVAETR